MTMENILRHLKLIQVESQKTTTFSEFLELYSPKDFVNLHQDYFKDYYLQNYFIDEYNISDDVNDLYGYFDLFSLIKTKYEDFLSNLGREEAHKWLNPSLYSNYSSYLKTEDYTFDEVDFILGTTDEIDEDFYDKFSELTGDSFSVIGYGEFIGALISEYELHMS